MENSKLKICLNCKGDWDKCKGLECICMDGVCCDLDEGDFEKRLLDRSQVSFGYIEHDKCLEED